MQITEIYYEKVFPIAPYINEKIGVKVTLGASDHPARVLDEAKHFVNQWGHKLVEQERSPDTSYFKSPSQADPYAGLSAQSNIDEEFETFKRELSLIDYREDAEEFLNKSSFKLSIEAKRLVQQKPLKTTNK